MFANFAHRASSYHKGMKRGSGKAKIEKNNLNLDKKLNFIFMNFLCVWEHVVVNG
jgi:hypothetical protein